MLKYVRPERKLASWVELKFDGQLKLVMGKLTAAGAIAVAIRQMTALLAPLAE